MDSFPVAVGLVLVWLVIGHQGRDVVLSGVVVAVTWLVSLVLRLRKDASAVQAEPLVVIDHDAARVFAARPAPDPVLSGAHPAPGRVLRGWAWGVWGLLIAGCF